MQSVVLCRSRVKLFVTYLFNRGCLLVLNAAFIFANLFIIKAFKQGLDITLTCNKLQVEAVV